jgi:hypothetical protein
MKVSAALLGLFMLVAFSFSAIPGEAKSTQLRVVDNVRVNIEIDLYTVDTDSLQAMLAMLPADLPIDPYHVRYVDIDGLLHVDTQVWMKAGMVVIDLHLNWRGSLALLDGERNVLISFAAKNAQVLLHVEVPSADLNSIGPTDIDAFGNLHTNAVASNGGEYTLDLKMHFIFHFENGTFTNVHIWLPEIFDSVLI